MSPKKGPETSHRTLFVIVVFWLSILLPWSGGFSAHGQDTSFVAHRPPSVPVNVEPAVATLPDDSLLSDLNTEPAPGTQWGRLSIASGLLATSYVGQYVIERKKWWSGDTAPFHFHSTLQYARGMDKIAHFYGAETQALTNARLLEWAGVKSPRAALLGAVFSFIGQTNVEIHDGFHPKWGFDVYDQVANGLGVGWFYAHDRVEFLRRFDVRLSYWHPNLRPMNKTKDVTMFTNDYSGHVYWLSTRVWDLLPQRVQPYWPRFLQLSLGVSVNDWEEYPDSDAYLSTHVSIDIDWREIIPRDSWLGRTSGDLLNRYHLPAPAIQLTPRPGISLLFVGQ